MKKIFSVLLLLMAIFTFAFNRPALATDVVKRAKVSVPIVLLVTRVGGIWFKLTKT
jgi:hypothetical protein